jgi:hypothetical protein
VADGHFPGPVLWTSAAGDGRLEGTSLPNFTRGHCHIEIVELPTAPKYSTLSYAWGDPEIMAGVQLDGIPFRSRRTSIPPRGDSPPRDDSDPVELRIDYMGKSIQLKVVNL